MRFSAKRGVVLFVAVSVLLLVVAGYWLFGFRRLIRQPVALAITRANASPEVRRSLGERLHVGLLPGGRLNVLRGSGNADLRIPVTGSRGEGTLLEWAQEDRGRWHICSLSFRTSDGNEVPIMPDAMARCERE